MIVDCHSHVWPSRSKLGQAKHFSCLAGDEACLATPEQHWDSVVPADVVIVHGFVSGHLEAEVPNEFVQKYVAQRPGRLIGFAGLDPTASGSVASLRRLRQECGFQGLTLSPACQAFHPCDTRAMRLYEVAGELGMPVCFLQGEQLPPRARMEYAQPVYLDEVARTFPQLKIMISHLGFPWIEQTIALLGKHPYVYANTAGLTEKPWQAFRSLTLAYEYGVVEKLLFASGFPCHTVKQAVESLYNLNKLAIDSVLPAVPREHLRGIVERDSLAVLGLHVSERADQPAADASASH